MVNIRLIAFCIVLFCLAASFCIVKAAPKPLSPAGSAQALSEKDVLGDWQTYGEGWRMILDADHTAAIYMEGYGETGPFASTWKLVGNDVVINSPSSLKDFFQRIGSNLAVIPYKGELVLLPRKELSVAEKRGFAATLCLWRVAPKHDSRKY